MRSRKVTILSAAVLLAVAGGVTGELRADEQSDEELAKNYYRLGADLYNRAEYAGALKQFLNAYKYAPRPQMLFNIGRCYEAIGQTEQAIEYYERFAKTKPENETQVRARITNLRRIESDKKTLAEKKRDRRAQQVRLRRRSIRNQSLHKGSLPAWIVSASGVTLVGIGVAFGLAAAAKEKELEDANEAGDEYSDHSEVEDQGKALEALQIAALAVGGAAVIAGGTMLFLHYRKRIQERRTAWIAPQVDQNTVAMHAGFSF